MRKAFGSAEGEWPAGVTEGLHEQLAGFARIPPGPVESAHSQPATDDDPRVAELDKMPQEVRTEAEEFLRDPRLLERVAEDITALGVVGENENKLILYLVGTSAQLPRPLAAITRGASSSGKSFLTEQVAKLFPPEVVLNATSLTTNALYYFESGTLRHRWVVAGERSRREDDETAEATRALREMIEAGKLAKAVPVKVGERIVTQLIEQPGPIAYTETTTLGEVFEEDQNRCLILSTDEGDGQTRLVLEATALAAAGRSSPDAERVRQRHYAVQRMIPQVDVVIPFAGAVAEHYPRGRVECRREFRHLLQLVKASALLHHLQRERDAAESVVANLDDYKVAERLARKPFEAAARGISEGARTYLAQLRERFGDRVFTTADAVALGGLPRRTLSGRLKELNGAGVLEQTEAPRGRVPAKWKLLGIDPEVSISVLPGVDTVRHAWEAPQRAGNAQPQIE